MVSGFWGFVFKVLWLGCRHRRLPGFRVWKFRVLEFRVSGFRVFGCRASELRASGAFKFGVLGRWCKNPRTPSAQVAAAREMPGSSWGFTAENLI